MSAAVCVLGSINMDVVVRVERAPAAGETVHGRSCDLLPGGKGANQAIAAANMGGQVDLVGAVGDDTFGAALKAYLSASGVGVTAVREIAGPSGTAVVLVDATGENRIVVTPGANHLLRVADVDAFFAGRDALPNYVVAQLEVPLEVVAHAFARAREIGATTVLNPSPVAALSPELLALTHIVVVNEVELRGLSGDVAIESADEASISARRWAESVGVATIVVTLGSRGLVAIDRGREICQPAPVVDRVVDTTGAGDCFCGAMAAFLAQGRPIDTALRQAQRAAALSVQRPGASPSFPRIGDLSFESFR